MRTSDYLKAYSKNSPEQFSIIDKDDLHNILQVIKHKSVKISNTTKVKLEILADYETEIGHALETRTFGLETLEKLYLEIRVAFATELLTTVNTNNVEIVKSLSVFLAIILTAIQQQDSLLISEQE